MLLLRILSLSAAVLGVAVSPASARLPAGFEKSTVATGLSQPAGLSFAPDGRLFVVEKPGRLRVVKNGALLATPFLDVTQVVQPPETFDEYAERGLLGVAAHPAFPNVPYVYLYYSVCVQPGQATCQAARNRVGRVTAGYQGDPDRADPASHVVLLDGIESVSGIHNAGWLGFGPQDGKLYVSVGDAGTGGARAQDLGLLNGKILRLELDGSAPADNPFAGVVGARPEIWALGFRNPWRCRFDPAGRLFCGDVGQAEWEEIDLVVAGGNYGWPETEGDFAPAAYPQFVRPIYTYDHTGGGSISLGDFGSRTNFPGDYQQSLFIGDYSWQWIRRVVLGPDGVTVESVAEFEYPAGAVTDLVAGPDGALYYTSILDGTVRRIGSIGTNQAPLAVASATPSAGGAPLVVQFSSAGSSDADGYPLTVVWDFGDGSAPSTDPAPTHTYGTPGAYIATLTVSDGRLPTPGTDGATVAITVGTPPVVTIDQPLAGATFQGGQTIPLTGRASDAEDGVLNPAALRWEIRFHHADHWHPFLGELPGSPQSFVTAIDGETAADVSYRIILRATDSSGLSGEDSLYIDPRTVTLRLETSPPGLQVTLDGQPVVAPADVLGVVGVQRTIGAPASQGLYAFASWSDGGARVHAIVTPAADAVYTATFEGAVTTTTPNTTTTSTTTTSTSTTSTSTVSTTTSAAGSTSTSSTVTATTTPATTSTSTSTSATTSSTTASTTTSSSSTSLTVTSSTTTTTTTTPSTEPLASTTTTTVPPQTTSTTLPSRCEPARTLASAACRLQELRDDVVGATSGDPTPVASGLERRLASASANVQRAVVLCDGSRLSRARAALRVALRRLTNALARIRRDSDRRTIPARVGVFEPRVRAVLSELRTVRDDLACP